MLSVAEIIPAISFLEDEGLNPYCLRRGVDCLGCKLKKSLLVETHEEADKILLEIKAAELCGLVVRI